MKIITDAYPCCARELLLFLAKRITRGSWVVLAFICTLPPYAMAADTHLCTDAGGSSPCSVPATTFVSGTGSSSQTLSGNSGADAIIIDSGQTAQMPDQTYYNFGLIQNNGTLYTGNSDGTSGFSTWPRIMGPGALLENFNVINNLTIMYVQDNSILGTNAPSGSGSILNHAGATFNNGSSQTYNDGSYYYGSVDLYDAANITNDGAFNNYGSLFMAGPGGGPEHATSFVNNGVLTNFAPLNTFFDAADFSIDGTTTNTGTIHNTVGAAMEISGTFNNTATGQFISEGLFEASDYGNGSSNDGIGDINNAGTFEITATGTGQASNFYSPGRFTQTAGSLKVDGQFVQSLFDIQGGIVTGGGVLDTTHSNVPGAAPTLHISPTAVLSPGNGTDNSMQVIGDGKLEGELIIEIFGGGNAGFGQGTSYDFLDFTADTTNNSSTGQLELGGLLTVDLLGGFTPNIGDWFDIIMADGGLNGDFLTPLIFDADGVTFERLLVGNSVRLNVIGVSAVPLPPALWLFASGLALMGIKVRRSTTTL